MDNWNRMEIRIGWRLDSDGDLSWMMIEIGFDNYLTCVDHQTVARYMHYAVYTMCIHNTGQIQNSFNSSVLNWTGNRI